MSFPEGSSTAPLRFRHKVTAMTHRTPTADPFHTTLPPPVVQPQVCDHNGPVSIERDRQELANQLASVVRSSEAEINRAILTAYERPSPENRNIVSVLASVAWLKALLDALPEDRADMWVREVDRGGVIRLDRILRGEFVQPVAELAEARAGPYDVFYDGNWPDGEARRRLGGELPSSARPGDILIGGDLEGGRIDIRVVEDPDGVLTGEILSQTWRDPPLDDVWVETYQRLESEYPEEVPQPGASG